MGLQRLFLKERKNTHTTRPSGVSPSRYALLSVDEANRRRRRRLWNSLLNIKTGFAWFFFLRPSPSSQFFSIFVWFILFFWVCTHSCFVLVYVCVFTIKRRVNSLSLLVDERKRETCGKLCPSGVEHTAHARFRLCGYTKNRIFGLRIPICILCNEVRAKIYWEWELVWRFGNGWWWCWRKGRRAADEMSDDWIQIDCLHGKVVVEGVRREVRGGDSVCTIDLLCSSFEWDFAWSVITSKEEQHEACG